MTDTPPPGATDAARVHGDPSALARVDVRTLASPRRLSPAEAERVFSPAAGVLPIDAVVIDASALKPQLTALVRWLMHGLGIWFISNGMAESREAALEPILCGLVLSGGALAWSWAQKHLVSLRIERAAEADPAKVVLR